MHSEEMLEEAAGQQSQLATEVKSLGTTASPMRDSMGLAQLRATGSPMGQRLSERRAVGQSRGADTAEFRDSPMEKNTNVSIKFKNASALSTSLGG